MTTSETIAIAAAAVRLYAESRTPFTYTWVR